MSDAPDGGTDPLAAFQAAARRAARDTFEEGVRLALGYALRVLDAHTEEAQAVHADQASAWLSAAAMEIRRMAVSEDLVAALDQHLK